MRRLALVLTSLGLLVLAFLKFPPLAGGQAAVSLSKPGQEDLTFWVNHDGLEQLDVEGEVGFGDMARILMRRRSNSEALRALRDRFTFRVRDMGALNTPDVLRAVMDDGSLAWRSKPTEFVVAAGRIFNLPIILENQANGDRSIEAGLGASRFRAALPAGKTGGYFLKVVEPEPGIHKRTLLLRAGGREIGAEILFDVRPLVKLRVRLADERGAPSAARIYITAADGLGYAPRGAISRYTAMSAEQYFHAADAFEIELPAGRTLIEATRGPEYELAKETLDLAPGRPAEVKIQLRRWEHMAAQGWYSSDAHIHANYTAQHHQVITPEDVRLQTLAEDLNNANMMVANSGGAFIHDEQFFEGKPHALSRPNYVIYWNEEFRNSGLYGHMSLFNLKSLVRPIYTGFRDTPHWEDYPANYAIAEAAQKQGGAVTYVHPGYGATFELASARELPVDLALGVIDAMDVVSNNFEPATMEIWYRLLNCGFRVAISAGTDSFTNTADHYTPGGGRVYVHTGPALDYAQWIQNYKRGRSFASTGPVIRLTVEGKEPGEELRFPEGESRQLEVRAEARSATPLQTLEIIVNGKPLLSRAAAGAKSLSIAGKIRLEASSWIAARALGPWHRLILNDAQALAHTSPVYVCFGDRRVRVPEDVRFYLDWIDQLIRRVEQRGRFATAERKQEVVALFRRAREIYHKIEAGQPGSR